MKVIVDNKIPYIAGEIEKVADEVVYLPGDAFTPQYVKGADALIIRTRTLCNRDLLEGSKVKFIATATIGFDHIDTDYCREAGIVWTNCPGCNASSVEQYIHACLLLLKREKGLSLKDLTIGIVGVGHVGSKIRTMAESLGMKVLLNDPPRADKGEEGFVDLETLAIQSDIITFHTPLIRDGKYCTYHLADASFFRSLQRTPYLMNSSRGEVVDTQALLNAWKRGIVKDVIIDTWENEPDICRELLRTAFIATPHIAGYSADGKANATRMALEAFCSFFGKQADFQISLPELSNISFSTDQDEAYLQVYNPTRDSEWLKATPEKFEWFRGNYPLRREKSFDEK